MRDRGGEKFESLKDFDFCDVHKKEPCDKWIRSINLIGMVIFSTHEIKVKTSPDRVIKASVLSALAFSGYLMGL
jgi:hypothetical protein